MSIFKSLRTKLIVITTAIVFFTAILNLTIGIASSYKSLTHNVESDLASIGQIAKVAIGSSLDKIKLGIEFIAASDLISDAEAAKPAMLDMLNKQKTKFGYQSLSVVTKNGDIISTAADLNGKNIAGEEYFKKALSGETYISSTTYDINKKLCVIAAAPVSNGSFSGVVMASLNPQVYSEIINKIRVGKTGNVFILDNQGTIIANMRPELVETRTNMIEKAKTDKSFATAAVVYTHMTQGKSGIEIYAYETGDRICYYEPIPNTNGWSYGAVAPIKEMTASISNTILGLSISSLVCIVLGIILTIISAGTISKPISLVCRRLELLANGDLHTDAVKVKAKDETGILAASLEKTVASLKGYITTITHTLKEIADGNMLVEVTGDFEGDFAPIKDSLITITNSLDAVLSDINQAAEQVSGGSEQVSNGAQALAQGATEQASSIEELSATINEISQNIKDNAEYAAQASKNVNDVHNEIEISNRHMQQMVSAMTEINESSNQISKIIKTIEDIAFQTNILALNAAVEAARAGAAGKGFAVVADEVRNLASKSAQAANNTTSLIENSIKQVENGTRIADETAKSLDRVVTSAKVVTETVEKISQSSRQQADSISQVTLGVEQISNVVQTNSATAQQSAAASEELSGQAQAMKELVGRFKLSKKSSDNQYVPSNMSEYKTNKILLDSKY